MQSPFLVPPIVEPATLRLVTVDDQQAALGLAVRFTLTEHAYANLAFGHWARALDGQVGRGHYRFVLSDQDEVRGFAGWALTSEEKAEDWSSGRTPLSDADCRAGDCVIFNVWIAKDRAAHRFMLQGMRAIMTDRKMVYFKRTYPDGRSRVVHMPINEFVADHVARSAKNRPDLDL